MSEQFLGVDKESLARAMKRVELDLHAMRDERYIRPPSAARIKHSLDRLPGYGQIHFAAMAYGRDAKAIIANGRLEGIEPATRFGKAVKAASELDSLTVAHTGNTCAESEPRLIRSLERHQDPNRQAKSEGWLGAAAILLDVNDRPFGYQKISGAKSTYVWDAVTVETRCGARALPDDCFAFVDFNPDYEAAIANPAAEVVAIHVSPESVRNLGFARFSTHQYPPTVRTAMAEAAANRCTKLAENSLAAATFRPEDIQMRVQALLDTGNVPILN
jgi:hypothetical protein